MDNKTASALEKVLALKSKGNFTKAIEKLEDLIRRSPENPDLYIEGMDLCLESGETLKAWSFFKAASSAGPACGDKIWTFAAEKAKTQNDLVLAKLLMEHAIRRRDLESGRQVACNLENHSAKELLKRIQVKKKSLQSSLGGGAPKGDLLVNIFSEILLLLRVGGTKEAAVLLVHTLEQKSIETDILEPFLVNLDKSFPGSSSFNYALGCCYSISEKYRKAVHHFNASIRADRTFLDEIIDRIALMRRTDRPLPEDLEMVLAESFLMKGALEKAAELMMHVLGQQPERAALVFDLASRYGGDHTAAGELDYAYIEAAILAKQNTRAVERIRAIHNDGARTAGLMDWLERKYTEHLLPSDIMIVYGDIALKHEMFERAASVLADVADMSPIDVPIVCRLLDPHRPRAQALDGLYERLSKEIGDSNDSSVPDESEGPEIQVFEKTEFRFTTDREPSASPPGEGAQPPEAAPFGLRPNGESEEVRSLPRESPYCARELTLTDDFDARYRAFLEGRMEDADIISLIDDASAEGETEKLKILLGALLRIKTDHPSFRVIERLLQHTCEDSMERRDSGAIALEKTGHID